MTSPSRKKRPTTPTSTSAATAPEAARVASVYHAVDRATRPDSDQRQPGLWLPAGWLAVLLLMTAAAPSFGAEDSSDGWRARGSVERTTRVAGVAAQRSPQHSASGSRPGVSLGAPPVGSDPSHPRVWRSGRSRIRQVAFEDDIAGPALRTAGRIHTDRFMDGEYRVAQQDAGPGFGDSLRKSFERPFGVPGNDRPAEELPLDADTADGLFDEPAPSEPEEPAAEEESGLGEYERERRPSIFDDEPSAEDLDAPDDFDNTAEEIAPGDIADDLAATADDDDLAEDRRNCSEGLAELKASRLSQIDLNITITGNEGEDYPYYCSLDDGTVFAPRSWCEVTYMWKASGLCHKPLYFEDEALERYGHSWGPFVQPLVSGAHFFGSVPILPYKMGLKTPNECVYALGHYRPGNCAPYLIDPIPFTWRAALYQAGASVGMAAVLP